MAVSSHNVTARARAHTHAHAHNIGQVQSQPFNDKNCIQYTTLQKISVRWWRLHGRCSKEHLLWSSHILAESSNDRKQLPETLMSWFFFLFFFFKSQKEAVQSKISGYGELFTRQAASSFFSRGEILSQHCYSKFNRKTAVSQGVVMVSKCAETDNAWQNTEATCLKRVTILILKLIVKIKKQWQENTFSILTVSW